MSKKPNHPAYYEVKMTDGSKSFLCTKHWQMEERTGAVDSIEQLPDEHQMSCSECVADYMNA